MDKNDLASRVLLRCTLLSFSFLLIWGLLSMFALPKLPFVYELHERLFGVTKEQVNLLNYSLIGLFKMAVFFFFAIPWLALRWTRSKI